MSKQSVRRHAYQYRLRLIRALDANLQEYMNVLIDLAEQHDFAGRHGENHMKELIEQGFFYRLKSVSETELAKIDTLEEARKLLGL